MNVEVKRIDHLGIIAGTIKDLGIIEIIDEQMGIQDQEVLSHGEIVAGLILNGLGFVSRPLMLAPQFFENKALELLISEAARPEHFNRHKIGRVLDALAAAGCEKIFNAVAFEACKREDVSMKFLHGDTTSYSLSGEYDSDSDTHEVTITHGHSKDHRPDLKQVVQELLVSQDGGIPLATKAWSGNASDSVILRARAKELLESFKATESWCFIADSKLYNQETAEFLDKIKFITRVPAVLKTEQRIIQQALAYPEKLKSIENGYRLCEYSSTQYDIKNQRWIVVFSEQARTRSEKTLAKQIEKEKQESIKNLNRLCGQLFSCQEDAFKALNIFQKKLRYHVVNGVAVTCLKKFLHAGRPTPDTPTELKYQLQAVLELNQQAVDAELDQRSCFVLATNASPVEFSAESILLEYKKQDYVEKGFAFLKSPTCFLSSLFLKKPERIDALLMIMVLSLLVYSIAQRRLRLQLKKSQQTLPNQIGKPTPNPTMRWIFQLFEGVNFVIVSLNDVKTFIIEGINDLRKHILSFLSPAIQKIYFSPVLTG